MFFLELFLASLCIYGLYSLYFNITERFGLSNVFVEMSRPVREVLGGWILGVMLCVEGRCW